MKKITASIAIVLGLLSFAVFTGYRAKDVSSEFSKHVSIYPGAMIISSEIVCHSEQIRVFFSLSAVGRSICSAYFSVVDTFLFLARIGIQSAMVHIRF